ncbi:hypothetical protein Tco_0585814 [Tanacetum coccineum]
MSANRDLDNVMTGKKWKQLVSFAFDGFAKYLETNYDMNEMRGMERADILCERKGDGENFVWLEIPDPVEDLKGYKLVTELMMHGPYGAANLGALCMQNGPCNKHFPKKYNDRTFFDRNGRMYSLARSDPYSPKDSREEHMEIGTVDAEAVTDLGISDGVGVDTKDGIEASQLMASEKRAGLTDRIRRLGRENLRVRALLCIERDQVDSLRHHMALLQEEFRHIRRDRDDARRRLRRLESFDMTITRSGMTPEVIEELIAQRVAEALANYEATRATNALETENQSQNGSDDDNGNGGNEDGGNNGNGNRNENGRGAMPVARVCTYQDFVKYQLLNFKGTEGVVGLTRWFEKMETVFYINNCPEVYQVKYATCTLLDSALTWWNSNKRTIRVDVAFAMTWRDLMKMMTKVYCPRNEIQKIETEL